MTVRGRAWLGAMTTVLFTAVGISLLASARYPAAAVVLGLAVLRAVVTVRQFRYAYRRSDD